MGHVKKENGQQAQIKSLASLVIRCSRCRLYSYGAGHPAKNVSASLALGRVVGRSL